MVTSFLLSMLEHLGQNIFKQKSFWIGCLINYSLIFVDALILRLFLIFTIHLKEEKNGCKRKIFCFVIKVFSFFLFIPRFDQILFPKGMKYAKWTFTSFSAKVNVSYSSFKTFASTFWKFYIELHQIENIWILPKYQYLNHMVIHFTFTLHFYLISARGGADLPLPHL